MEIPPDANNLPFIRTYVLKYDGIQKARAPCNGSPCIHGTVMLEETYVDSLDQTIFNISWAISAAKYHIIIGPDASNKFIESLTPKAPLFMSLDHQFHLWWKSKGRPPIQNGYGINILKDIQYHLE